MHRIALAAALIFTLPALAQTTASPPAGAPVTGAIDAPKTTTSGNEKATTDAAGVPKGTAGAGASSSDLNATAATKRRHHHRAKPGDH